jgi:DNA-binding XRE family transcriptional regulator
VNIDEKAIRKNGAIILKHIRRQHGLTQHQLGKQIGVRRARISALETERSEMSVAEWRTLCQYFKLSMELICMSLPQLLASLRRAR